MKDEDDKPPHLRIAIENPSARTDRELAHAKQRAISKFKSFTAALLRVMAGSQTEVTRLIRYHSDFLDSLEKLNALAGHLTALDLENALSLPHAEYVTTDDEYGHRRWIRDSGFDDILQGALRLAAHKLLGENPHFGGKHSEEVIESGIRQLERLKQPIPAPLRVPPRAIAERPAPPKENKRSKEQERNVASTRGGYKERRSRTSRFDEQDLKALRKAIKDRDEQRIAELRAKLGRRFTDD